MVTVYRRQRHNNLRYCYILASSSGVNGKMLTGVLSSHLTLNKEQSS